MNKIDVNSKSEQVYDIPDRSLAFRVGMFIGGLLRDSDNLFVKDSLEPETADTADFQEVKSDKPETSLTLDNSKDILATINQNLDKEINETKQKLDAINESEDKRINLLRKLQGRNGGRVGFRGQDNHYDSMSEVINNKFGGRSEAVAEIEKLERNLLKRSWQKNYIGNGQILEFEEDVDPAMLRRYLHNPNENLGENFHLKRNNTPPKDPEQAQKLLKTLPFIHRDMIQRSYNTDQIPEIVIQGNWQFPLDRIIGAISFEDWSGRKDYPNNKSFTPVNINNIEKSSRGAITDYAQTEDNQWLIEKSPRGNDICIEIIRDSDGEFWGMVTSNGSHTVAAAKLRGDSTIPIGNISILPDEYMGTLNFSVKDKFNARK